MSYRPNNTRDTSNHSEHSESYIIIGTGNPAVARAWRDLMNSREIGYAKGTGVYKGMAEDAYTLNARHWGTIKHVLAGQESVLVLGPKVTGSGFRPATLHYLDGRLPEYLGDFMPVEDEDVNRMKKTADAWTYDMTTDTYYICQR